MCIMLVQLRWTYHRHRAIVLNRFNTWPGQSPRHATSQKFIVRKLGVWCCFAIVCTRWLCCLQPLIEVRPTGHTMNWKSAYFYIFFYGKMYAGLYGGVQRSWTDNELKGKCLIGLHNPMNWKASVSTNKLYSAWIYISFYGVKRAGL